MTKKIFAIILIFSFFISVFAGAAFSQSAGGTLELIRGNVIYKLPNQNTWAPLVQKSIDLVVGTTIQTKENSQATIKFADGSKVLIGEMTLFKVQSREEKEKQNVYTIRLFGKTFIEVRKKDTQNNFKIQTPTALATIRGSKMLVSVGDNLVTQVTSTEGTIDVASTYLFKGTVLYLDGNKVTLETEQGIKKVYLDPDAIIPERNGVSVIKPTDRIAVYGRPVENGGSSSIGLDSAQASLTTLPVKKSDYNNIAQISALQSAAISFISFTNPQYSNTLTLAQIGFWVGQTPVTVVQPPIPVTPIMLPTGVQAPAITTVAPGFQPTTPQAAPPTTPANISQAASQSPKSAGQASGNQTSTTEGNAEKAMGESPTGGGTGTAEDSVPGGGVTGAKTTTVTSAPPIISPSATTGIVQFNITGIGDR